MMTKKVSVSEAINWVFEQYKQLRLELKDQKLCHIADIVTDKNGRRLCIIHLHGSATVLKLTPTEILSDNKFVDNFSSRDIRTITYYACTELDNENKKKITVKNFCNSLGRLVFGIRSENDSETIYKTSTEISSDKKLLNSLSPEDAHMVGYLTASEAEAIYSEQITKDRSL